MTWRYTRGGKRYRKAKRFDPFHEGPPRTKNPACAHGPKGTATCDACLLHTILLRQQERKTAEKIQAYRREERRGSA